MARGIEALLQEALGTKTASATPAGNGGELDVAAFAEDLGKTASALDKAAEMLPTTPAIAAAQLKMLSNPMGVSRADAHNLEARQYFSAAHPGALSSLRIPSSLEEIQGSTFKTASAEPDSVLSFASRL